MFKKILYPTAFEEFTSDVLGCLTNFKNVGTEEIVLLHVIYASQLPQVHEGYVLRLADALRHLLNAKMTEAANIVEAAGIKVKKRIELGVPYQEILRVAEEEKVSLVVAGRERKGFLGEIFVGSITDKLIRHGTTPVYIPKYPGVYGADRATCEAFCRNPFRKILYPTDWSDSALKALDYVKQFRNAGVEEVVVAHIMDEKAMKLQPEEKFREFERIDEEELAQVKVELEKEGFKVSPRLCVGNPRAALITLAKTADVSLIVIGSHGKGRAESILWGSVSRNVTEYSNRPTLVLEFRFDAMINPRIDCSQDPLAVRLSPQEVVDFDLEDPKRIKEWGKFFEKFNGPVHPHAQIDELYHCGGGVHSFAIDPYGKLAICELSGGDGYDLSKGSFRNGWEDHLLKIRKKKITKQTKCVPCEIKAMCGMCPENAQLENKDPEEPVDFMCQVSHLRAKALGIEVKPHGECEYCRAEGSEAGLP